MEQQLEQVLHSYYAVLNITPTRRRYKHDVQARAAMMVAMRKHSTTTMISKIFDMDHSSVVYHTNKHDANMISWDGYAKFYKLARRMCNKSFRYKTMAARLHSVRNEISLLKRTEQNILNEFKSKSYEPTQF